VDDGDEDEKKEEDFRDGLHHSGIALGSKGINNGWAVGWEQA